MGLFDKFKRNDKKDQKELIEQKKQFEEKMSSYSKEETKSIMDEIAIKKFNESLVGITYKKVKSHLNNKQLGLENESDKQITQSFEKLCQSFQADESLILSSPFLIEKESLNILNNSEKEKLNILKKYDEIDQLKMMYASINRLCELNIVEKKPSETNSERFERVSNEFKEFKKRLVDATLKNRQESNEKTM